MTLKTITREEANLTTWLLSQVALLEQNGKKVATLELVYDGINGGTGINLAFETSVED